MNPALALQLAVDGKWLSAAITTSYKCRYIPPHVHVNVELGAQYAEAAKKENGLNDATCAAVSVVMACLACSDAGADLTAKAHSKTETRAPKVNILV